MQQNAGKNKYLLTAFEISLEKKEVRSIEVAERLCVSRASVSKMLKILAKTGLVQDCYYSEIILTDSGKEKARQLYENYKMIFHFFSSTLGFSDEKAREDALLFISTFPEESSSRLADTLKNSERLSLQF